MNDLNLNRKNILFHNSLSYETSRTLAHFGLGSFNFGQVVAKWFLLLHIWHPPNTMEEDDASRLCTVPLNKLISVLFNAVACFSIMVFEVPSSCSSFRGSKGVFPSSLNNLSNFVVASINYSISITILTTHKF